ncbi:MAG: undecaprenyl-diphosphate phosphatase [Candidatus Omnitrophota bacterium]
MNIIDIIILGIVEGITEFLPVSSTGHLILTAKYLGYTQTGFLKSFEIFIQLGAILAVVVLYGRTLLRKKEVWTRIMAAFVPTAVIGFLLYKLVKNYLFESHMLIAWSLFWGGLVIIIFDLFHKDKKSRIEDIEQIPYKTAVIIGLFQTIAIIPGVSRSAASIIGGLTMGIKRKTVVEFSFLLAVPTILAATCYDLLKSSGDINPDQFGYFALGFLVSFVVALFSIKFLLQFIKRFNFIPFGIYRILLFALILSTNGCLKENGPDYNKFTRVGDFFGAYVKIDVCENEDRKETVEQALDEIWDRFADIHWRLSVYDPNSDLNRINKNGYTENVKVGEDTYQLIKNSMEYHEISKGVFDITIYPLIKLWKENEKKNTIPTPEELKAVKEQLGIQQIQLLSGNRIHLLKEGLKLNIDSIGDGFAADEAARILREYGIRNFLVDASGELYAGGINCKGQPWHVGVRDPQDTTRLIDVVEAADISVSTSGNYERFYTIQGKQWSHIINPITGYPSDQILSATVISPNTEFSDFWSTALCILEPDQGASLTDALGEGYASLVIVRESDGGTRQVKSQNYDRFSVKPSL